MRLSVFSPVAAALLALPSILTAGAQAMQIAADRGASDANQTVHFSLYLPLQNRVQLDADFAALHNSASPLYHHWLTPEQFRARYAPSAAQFEAVRSQLAGLDLSVTEAGPRLLHVSGSAAAVSRALGTPLRNGRFGNQKNTIMATTAPTLSGPLAQVGAIVTGLSGRIRMQSHAHHVTTDNRYTSTGAYWFTDLKQAYSFPSYQTYTGKGTTIGILMSGDFNPSDMDLYFSHEKLATPSFTTVQIDGGLPFSVDNSFETHLDLQQSGGMAPNAKIILYNMPDLTDESFIDGLTRVVNDNKADVVSMSFGGPEAYYTAAYSDGTDYTYLLMAEEELFEQGNMQGITFVASSGDNGALPVLPPACFDYGPNCGAAQPGVEFPASSPHVVAVGGTNLVTTHTTTTDLNSAYVREQAYADPLGSDIFYGTSATGLVWGSGGGDSMFFRKPAFQALTNTGNSRFRTVPDVSLHMGGCPVGASACSPDDSADVEVLGGRAVGVIGTSASAPDFAGLTALAVQRFGTRLGNENFYIYALAATQQFGLTNVFKQGIPGYNGLYTTTARGYNRVLGNGTLSGTAFLLAPLIPPAGTPQTPSNP